MNPRQWSLTKQSSLKVANDGPKVSKQAEAKRDGVINTKILQAFNSLLASMYLKFEGIVFQQVAVVPMGTNRDHLIENLFLFKTWVHFFGCIRK